MLIKELLSLKAAAPRICCSADKQQTNLEQLVSSEASNYLLSSWSAWQHVVRL
jgi:hypothetical protein